MQKFNRKKYEAAIKRFTIAVTKAIDNFNEELFQHSDLDKPGLTLFWSLPTNFRYGSWPGYFCVWSIAHTQSVYYGDVQRKFPEPKFCFMGQLSIWEREKEKILEWAIEKQKKLRFHPNDVKDRKDKLRIFKDFQVDNTLPKFNVHNKIAEKYNEDIQLELSEEGEEI